MKSFLFDLFKRPKALRSCSQIMIVLISLFCFSIFICQNDALQFSKQQRTQHCTRPTRFLRKSPLLSPLQMEKSGLMLEVSDITTNGNSNVNIIKSIGIPRIMPPNPAQGNEWYMWLNVRGMNITKGHLSTLYYRQHVLLHL